jgi:glycosyltransferase involved in cell wall biosynthesis
VVDNLRVIIYKGIRCQEPENKRNVPMPSVLWWGRFDPQYSRNRIVCKLFSDLGWLVAAFRPRASPLGWVEAHVRRLSRPDLIWVPCFRQRDVTSAAYWAKKWRVPLIIDPLISAYEKDVFEKRKWLPDDRRALKRRRWEAALLQQADAVVADTAAHAHFYQETLGVRAEKTAVLFVGAEEGLFEPQPHPVPQEPFEILFYGSYLHLQGVDVIVAAADRLRQLPLRWVLLGDGDLRPGIEQQARGVPNIKFEPWIAYTELPQRMARAHVVLGIFGTSPKAGMVIPNKMFQTMASARPVITRRSTAYPEELSGSDVIGWVPEGQPDALAAKVRDWMTDPAMLAERGQATRRLYETFFSETRLRGQLAWLLEKRLGLPGRTS